MNTNIFTTALTAIVGVAAAYFICSMMIGEIPSQEVKILEEGTTTNLEDPNPEIFNYKAINPTVEVYIGTCDVYDYYGNCVEEDYTYESNDTEESENEANDSSQDVEQQSNPEASNQEGNP